MKNRTAVHHGLLTDLALFLKRSGWTLETPKGEYEVLRARKNGYPRPLLIHDRTSGGCGYSIDERDMKVYRKWHQDRRKRGLDPYWWSTDAEKAENENVINGRFDRRTLVELK